MAFLLASVPDIDRGLRGSMLWVSGVQLLKEASRVTDNRTDVRKRPGQKEWGTWETFQIWGQDGELTMDFCVSDLLQTQLPQLPWSCPVHLLRKERVHGVSGSLPPRPHRLLFSCNPKDRYRTVTHATVSSFRSLAPASWALTCDMEDSVAEASLNRDDIAAFCYRLAPSRGHDHLSLEGRCEGRGKEARQTLNSWYSDYF